MKLDSRSQIMARAKRRTLRLAVAIVVTFVICWTPYAITLMWDQLDRKSLVTTLPPWLRDLFFIFAVTNSCVNPFVHSSNYFIELVRSVGRCRPAQVQPDGASTPTAEARAMSLKPRC